MKCIIVIFGWHKNSFCQVVEAAAARLHSPRIKLLLNFLNYSSSVQPLLCFPWLYYTLLSFIILCQLFLICPAEPCHQPLYEFFPHRQRKEGQKSFEEWEPTKKNLLTYSQFFWLINNSLFQSSFHFRKNQDLMWKPFTLVIMEENVTLIVDFQRRLNQSLKH